MINHITILLLVLISSNQLRGAATIKQQLYSPGSGNSSAFSTPSMSSTSSPPFSSTMSSPISGFSSPISLPGSTVPTVGISQLLPAAPAAGAALPPPAMATSHTHAVELDATHPPLVSAYGDGQKGKESRSVLVDAVVIGTDRSTVVPVIQGSIFSPPPSSGGSGVATTLRSQVDEVSARASIRPIPLAPVIAEQEQWKDIRIKDTLFWYKYIPKKDKSAALIINGRSAAMVIYRASLQKTNMTYVAGISAALCYFGAMQLGSTNKISSSTAAFIKGGSIAVLALMAMQALRFYCISRAQLTTSEDETFIREVLKQENDTQVYNRFEVVTSLK